jgi:hypothetical protein
MKNPLLVVGRFLLQHTSESMSHGFIIQAGRGPDEIPRSRACYRVARSLQDLPATFGNTVMYLRFRPFLGCAAALVRITSSCVV